jgi:CubicO group peptidase (beta-lactamase class C family)
MIKRGLALVIALLCAALLQPTPAPAHRSAIDTVIGEYTRAHGFDGTVMVEQRGKRVYRKNFGVADRAFNIPIKNDTRFKIASITKAFTAVLILQLYEQGKIDLDQPIKTYLPEYTGAGAETVKVHHLLNHTSGLPNLDQGLTSYEQSRRQGIDHYQKVYTTDELFQKYRSDKLVHEPGKAFDYNNADYIYLGKIIEKITGKTYEQVLQEQILTPLKMRDSGLLKQSAIVPKLAPTYLRPDEASPLENDMPTYIENWYAAGAMYSSIDDLARFSQALFGGKLLKPESVNRMLTPGLEDYGYGVWIAMWELRKDKKSRVVFRPGGIMGAQSMLVHILDDDTTILILSNTNRAKLDDFVYQIARALYR